MDDTVKRVAIFIFVTFSITWGFDFGVVYPLVAERGYGSDALVMLCVAASMFFPALGVLVTRLVTREGFRGTSYIAPRAFRRTWKHYAAAWLVPIFCILLGAGLYFVLVPAAFDPQMTGYVQTVQGQMAALGTPDVLSTDEIRMVGMAQLGILFVGPLANGLACFGEEWGWRGYLLPHLTQRLSVLPSLLVTGLVWGLWHAPVICLGHNYGTGYTGEPWLGIAAMCIFCIVLGSFEGFLTLRSGSCIPAILAHGGINGAAQVGSLFLAVGAGNAFVGPHPTGVVGGAFLIAVGVAAAVALVRRERAGKAQADWA